MDFMKLLRSFEEFLFEAASWLLFYPITLWRIVTRPLSTMAYSDAEQAQREAEGSYDDTLSPPLLLLITVVLVNLVGGAIHREHPHATSEITRAVLASPQNLAVFRGLIFSLIPLVAAATLLRRLGVGLSRSTLRPPFYAQCYLATPCAIVAGLGLSLLHRPDVPNAMAASFIAAGAIWFLVAQTRWFAKRLAISMLNAALTAAWALVRALLYLLAVLVPVALL